MTNTTPPATAREQAEVCLDLLFNRATHLAEAGIPANATRRAAEILFDDIAAMAGAWQEPEFHRLYPKLVTASTGNEATLLCQPGTRADAQTAALVNACSANWLELDEGYRRTPCHAGLYILPALLALAETDNTPVNKLLETLVVAYELITRIARAFPQQPSVMQSHGRFAALGAAIVTALHRGMPAHQLSAVAGAAATLITPAPRNHLALGALVRNVWAGVGAQSGMRAADWASAGISGSPGSIFDVYVTVLRGGFQPEALTEEFGPRWAVEDGYTKLYACCQHLHAAVEAVLGCRSDVLHKGLEQIDHVLVHTHDLALPLDNHTPHNTLSAKFSMSHAVAAALVCGEGGAGAFDSSTLDHPEIRRLRERVVMQPWPEPIPAPPNDRPARVSLRFTDGSTLQAECLSARGGADRPLSYDERLEKIAGLTAQTYPGLMPLARQIIENQGDARTQGWRDVLHAIQRTPAKENA